MKINLPTRREIRHANCGIAVAAVILVAGVLLVHEAGEGAIKAVGVFGFISALVVAHGLDALAERRERREGKEPQ